LLREILSVCFPDKYPTCFDNIPSYLCLLICECLTWISTNSVNRADFLGRNRGCSNVVDRGLERNRGNGEKRPHNSKVTWVLVISLDDESLMYPRIFLAVARNNVAIANVRM
jgi:hypothetical protein